jgi:hypothetical protein
LNAVIFASLLPAFTSFVLLICIFSINFFASFRELDSRARFDVYQSQPEEITLREDFGAAPFTFDDGFGK